MPTPAELAAAYTAGAAALRAAVAGMTREHLLARPVAGKMSTLEVVAHLADFEPVLADRIKFIAALETPALAPADDKLFLAKLRYHDRDVEEELNVITAIRTSVGRFIAGLTPAELARTGVHATRGPLTLEAVIGMAINHIPNHIAFIEAKKAALAAG